MGLCRCPLRKVSTLYCYKHQVNVCESCLVDEHGQCIVRSYLSWLKDNDYSTDCFLCKRSLSESDEETIRLICYDLFHWACLDEYFRSLPNHTAPDGYTCPICKAGIFPPANLVSPVADRLRAKLTQAAWANRFLSLSFSESSNSSEKQPLLTETENNGYVIVNSTPAAAAQTRIETSSGLSHHPHRTIDLPEIPRTEKRIDIDSDDDKYKRRSVFTWFARWLRSRQPSNRKSSLTSNNNKSSTRTTFYLIIFILFIFVTVIAVLYHVTRGDSNDRLNLDDDPQFNPLNNPFVRVAGQFINNRVKDPKSPIDTGAGKQA